MVLKGMPWLNKRVSRIEETSSNFEKEIKEIKNIEKGVVNEFKPWTPLKLAFLDFTLDVCAIVANRKFIKKNYIDLFAGSGMNKIEGRYEDYFIGSPFISLLNHRDKFTKFFFCEKDIYFFKALKKRIGVLELANCELYCGDCNHKLDDILNKINKTRSYNFFFIDPSKLEFSWESMGKILKIRSDILLTFMPRAAWRSVTAQQKTGNKSPALDRFFGNSSWKKAIREEDLVEIYKMNILKERKDAIIISTRINSKRGFNYYLFFITHQTRGNNPWLDPIRSAKEEIEKNSDSAIKTLLDIIKKRQFTLKDFESLM